MSTRTLVLGLPRYTAITLKAQAARGSAVVCFDEYAAYFSRWHVARGYGSAGDRAEETARLLEAVIPLSGWDGDLWVQGSPNRSAAKRLGRL